MSTDYPNPVDGLLTVCTVRDMKAMNDIVRGDVCVRCGATVRVLSPPDGSLEGGIDLAPSRSVIDGSLEGGIDLAPLWACDCGPGAGPQVPEQ